MYLWSFLIALRFSNKSEVLIFTFKLFSVQKIYFIFNNNNNNNNNNKNKIHLENLLF